MDMNREWTPRETEYYTLSQQSEDLFASSLRSGSGGDWANAERYACERLVYIDLAEGRNLEESIARADVRWRRHAATMQSKATSGPKWTRGPSSGLRVMRDRWADLDAFLETTVPHIRTMVKIVEARLASGAK